MLAFSCHRNADVMLYPCLCMDNSLNVDMQMNCWSVLLTVSYGLIHLVNYLCKLKLSYAGRNKNSLLQSCGVLVS